MIGWAVGGQGRGVVLDGPMGLNEGIGIAVSVRHLVAVNDPRLVPGRVDHAVEEGNEQAVPAVGQRRLAVIGMLPEEAMPEGQEDGQAGKSLLEGGHDLATATAGLGGVVVPGAATRDRAAWR